MGRMGVSPMRAAATGLKTSMVATARTVGPMRAAAGLSAFRTVSPMRAAAGLSATRMMGAPRGVDLDLGQFDLSNVTHVDSGDINDQQNVAMGKCFWDYIEDSSSKVFTEEDAQLLRAIF